MGYKQEDGIWVENKKSEEFFAKDNLEIREHNYVSVYFDSTFFEILVIIYF